MLAKAVLRQRLLDQAIADTETTSRTLLLAQLVETAHAAPPAVEAELGPDPFAQRALVELGLSHAVGRLDALRKEAKHAWIKAAAVRAMAPAPGGEARLEEIALDKTSSEDEVVAAVDMIFSSEKAGTEALEKLSFDERPRVRRAVASALREKVKDLKTLERLMKDPDASVRGAATEAARAAARRLGLEMPGPKKPPSDDEDGK
jgi:hypothetical protein